MADPIDAPDPNGCERCGSVTCNVAALREARDAAPVGTDERDALWRRFVDARDFCEARPVVDWRAAYARAMAEIALRTPEATPAAHLVCTRCSVLGGHAPGCVNEPLKGTP